MEARQLVLLRAVFNRPTNDQALVEAMKAYAREVEPRSRAKLEALVVAAREQVASEERERAGR